MVKLNSSMVKHNSSMRTLPLVVKPNRLFKAVDAGTNGGIQSQGVERIDGIDGVHCVDLISVITKIKGGLMMAVDVHAPTTMV